MAHAREAIVERYGAGTCSGTHRGRVSTGPGRRGERPRGAAAAAATA